MANDETSPPPQIPTRDRRIDLETRAEIDAILEENKHLDCNRERAKWLLAKRRLGIEGPPTREQFEELDKIADARKPLPPRK